MSNEEKMTIFPPYIYTVLDDYCRTSMIDFVTSLPDATKSNYEIWQKIANMSNHVLMHCRIIESAYDRYKNKLVGARQRYYLPGHRLFRP
jgi:hypothetical protein